MLQKAKSPEKKFFTK